jgi:cysteine desulfurase
MALLRKNREICLDYAASTPVAREVLRSMKPYWRKEFGNPFSRHSLGERALEAVLQAKRDIAHGLSVRESEIHFTSGATESNALMLRGVVEGRVARGSNIILSEIEHASLQDIDSYAESRGVEVRRVRVTKDGIVDSEDLMHLVDERTILVSIMYINSEIGTIQPIKDISRALKKLSHPPLFHTDASQAPLWLSVDMKSLGVDMATFDAQKMYGPKGVGFLYVKNGISLKGLFFSHKEAKTVRPGTIPTPLVVGCARALERALRGREERVGRVKKLRDYLIDELGAFDELTLNGSRKDRVANNVSVTWKGAHHEYLRALLNRNGIMCSTGSACSAGDEVVQSVVALGEGKSEAVRFSLGEETRKRDINTLIHTLREIREKGLL